MDGDGLPNHLDLDSDGDGIPDVIEAGGTDGNNDGIADGTDSDNDGIIDTPLDPFAHDADSDGIPDAYEPNNVDTDGDGTNNQNDDDDDGDLIPTLVECFWPFYPDLDVDFIPDYLEHNGPAPAGDTDGDNIPDAQDGDSDGDGIPDAVEGSGDTDGDGVPDHRDLDSDNDGINDVIEGGGTDTDGDGLQDPNGDGTDDSDNDGIVDSADPDESGTALPTPDTDNDGQDDYQDLDSDNNTVSDLIEGGSGAADTNNDGVADGPDADDDGIVDNADAFSGFGDAPGPALPDKDSGSDNDNAPDYRDADDDGMGGARDIDNAGNGELDTNDDGMLGAGDTSGGTDAEDDGVDSLIDTNDSLFGGLGEPINIRLLAVNPVMDEIIIKNFGPTTVDISSYWLCRGSATYLQLTDGTLTPSGSLTLAPGATVTITGFGLTTPNGDLGLYHTGGGFSNPANMADFVQWGAGSQGRATQAVMAGIWDDVNNFVAGNVPYSYIGNGSENGSTFWTDSVNLSVPLKVFLQGGYDVTTDTMADTLRSLTGAQGFPLISPYGDGATTTTGVLGVNDPNSSIVDWVLVELRGTGALSTTVVISQSALLQRNGDPEP